MFASRIRDTSRRVGESVPGGATRGKDALAPGELSLTATQPPAESGAAIGAVTGGLTSLLLFLPDERAAGGVTWREAP